MYTEPKLEASGSGTVSWGIDFGNGTGTADDRYETHGFKNDWSWKVYIPFIKGHTRTTPRKEDATVYGEVNLKSISLGFESKHDKNGKNFYHTGKVDGLDAKIVFNGGYLQVFGAPGFKTNKAHLFGSVGDKDHGYEGSKFEPGFDGAGLKIGYQNADLKNLDVGLKIGSNTSWEGKKDKVDDPEKQGTMGAFKGQKVIAAAPPPPTTNDIPEDEIWISMSDGKSYYKDGKGTTLAAATYSKYERKYDKAEENNLDRSKYAIGFDFSMKPLGEMLGFGLTFNTMFDPAEKYNNGLSGGGKMNKKKALMNIGADVTSSPVKDLKLKFGFDGGWAFLKDSKDDVFAWDMLFDVSYRWVSAGLYVASEGTPFAGMNEQTGKEIADMGAYIKLQTAGDLKGLNAGVFVATYKILTKVHQKSSTKEPLPIAMKLWADYTHQINDSMWIKPFFTFWGETGHVAVSGHAGKPSTTDYYFGIAYNVGLAYQPLEKVEVTAKWEQGALQSKQALMIKTNANHNNHNGKFVLSCKVSY